MEKLHEMVDEINGYVHEMIIVLEEGSENASQYRMRVDMLIQVLEELAGAIPSGIYNTYREFVDSFVIFCKQCKNEQFLINNVDNMASSLNLLEECFTEMSKECKNRVRTCACCGVQVVYQPLADYYRNMRKQYGVEKEPVSETLNVDEYTCPNCSCSDRDRMIISFLKSIHIEEAEDKRRVLQIAPAASIHNWLLRKCPQIIYETADLFMEGVTYQSDIQDLKEMDDESFDLIICSHVLEHVQDDRKAMAAMKRVLKKDGRIVFLVPIDLSIDKIDEEWGCSEEENWRRFGQNDHCRVYSREGLLERLREFFYVHELQKEYFGEEVFRECGLTDTSTLYVLTKNEDVKLDMAFEHTVDKELCENGPLVSVIMSAYNHAPFVAEAIESVLNQSYKNIEFLVADDASPDDTAKVMQKYSKYFAKEMYFTENKGDRSLDLKSYAKGKYIALMHSDDIWNPDKIALQVQYMEEHPECGVCLSWCRYTDENQNILDDSIFIQKNRTSAEWMKFFWEKGSALCNPSSLARKAYFYNDIPYGSAGRQIPDLFRWIDMVQKTEIHIVPMALTFMRRYHLEGKENTSAANKRNLIRHNLESGINWLWVIRKMDSEFFIKSFHDLMRNPDAKTEAEIKLEKYFLMLSSNNDFIQHSALTYFSEIYEEVIDIMTPTYGYTRKELWEDEIRKGFGKNYLR